MNNHVIYELYEAAYKANSDIKDESFNKINNYLFKLTNKNLRDDDLKLGDIPTDVSKKDVSILLDLVQDQIVLMNKGISKSKTLGYFYYICHKLLFIAEILNLMLYKRSALFVSEKLIKIAKKYYFHQIVFQANRIIYANKGLLNDKKGEVVATKEFIKYLKFYEIEKRIEIQRNAIFSHYDISKARDQRLVEFCNEVLCEFREYENSIPSFYFHFHFYYIQHTKFLTENKHDDVYRTAIKALTYFDNLPFEYTPGKLIFTYILIIYTIQKREFNECHKLINRGYSYISDKSRHWFRLRENLVILLFHEGRYDEAVETFYSSISNQYFDSLLPMDKDRWRLYEAYVNLALESKSAIFENRRKRFGVQKFINDQPRFSKDKRAMNIPVLIAQMLFFIVRRQYNHAIDRIEALEKYTSRYLRNDETFRSNCFIKMILEIPKNSFNQLRVQRAAQKYFERLLDSEIELINQPFEIEIIPYERLWAMVMDHLRADHHYTPKRRKNEVVV